MMNKEWIGIYMNKLGRPTFFIHILFVAHVVQKGAYLNYILIFLQWRIYVYLVLVYYYYYYNSWLIIINISITITMSLAKCRSRSSTSILWLISWDSSILYFFDVIKINNGNSFVSLIIIFIIDIFWCTLYVSNYKNIWRKQLLI